MYVDQCDPTASKLVQKNDPRVTKVGAFIRKTSLDELPQLINVALKGDLSLVGPRPHAVHAKAADRLYDEAVDGYFARHRVKPGITGWAQISGWRGETDTEEKIQRRVEHDLHYIENWSCCSTSRFWRVRRSRSPRPSTRIDDKCSGRNGRLAAALDRNAARHTPMADGLRRRIRVHRAEPYEIVGALAIAIFALTD
jgi:hypothetical protein